MKRFFLYSFAALLFAVMLASAQVQQRAAGQNALQGDQARATIEGTVTRADNGQPLKNARVTLRSANNRGGQNSALADLAASGTRGTLVNLISATATVTTDGNGRFALTGVAAGQYRISAERDGFVRSEHGQRTPTGRGASLQVVANQHLMLDLKMLQASVISGRVITADGEPAAQATVQAYTYQYSNGQRSLAEVKNAQTNDLGEYRLFWMEPGEYFISVTNNQVADTPPVGTVDVSQNRGGRGAANVQLLAAVLGDREGPVLQAISGSTNPPVFYPGTVDPDGAAPINVVASSDVRGMDFNLRPIRTANVSGRVVAPFPLNQTKATVVARGRGGQPQGNDGNAVQIQTARAPVQLSLNRVGGSRAGLGGLLNLRLGTTPVNPDGTFEIKSVAPGEYNLTATARDSNGQQHTARSRISVGTADVSNITVAVRPGVEVRGRILLDGTPPQQFKFSNLRVNLVAEDSGPVGEVSLLAGGRGDGRVANVLGGSTTVATVGEDGSFTLKDVGAQEYRVRVTGLPQGSYVQAGRIESNDALNAPFTIDSPGTQLQIQLGFTPGRVSGNVTDDRGASIAGVQAVLVPDEGRRGRSDAYFNVTTDANGQFAMNNVPPGRYKIFAWEDIPAGAYQYPDFLRRYEDRGQSLTVNANGAITANVRLIPAN